MLVIGDVKLSNRNDRKDSQLQTLLNETDKGSGFAYLEQIDTP